MNIFLLIIFFFIGIYAEEKENDEIISNCFDINNKENYSIKQNEDGSKTLHIKGEGIMCDCNAEGFEYQFNITEITSIEFSNQITQIGAKCFSNLENIKEIIFEANSQLQTIKQNAFENTGITQLIIPKNVTEIEARSFEGCRQLQSIEFEEQSKIKIIGKRAFANCEELTTIS